MDGWLCGDCRSLNTPRARKCYRCNVPRQFGEAGAEITAATGITRGGLTAAPPSPGTPAAPGPADPLIAPSGSSTTAGGPAWPSAVPAGSPSASGAPSLSSDAPSPPLPPGAARLAAERGRPDVADARIGAWRGRLVVLLLILSTAWAALGLAVMLARGGSIGLMMDVVTLDWGVLTTLVVVAMVGALLTIVTAVAWFAWFDRVLRNVPPLTGEWPDSGRVGAVGWWLVPIIGLVKAPRIVGDVYNRLAVDGTPGLWLLGLWVVTWIGGTVGAWAVSQVLSLLPLPIDITLALSDLTSLLGQLCYIAAGALAIALVLSIQHAQRVRLAMGGAAAPRPPDVSEADLRFQAMLVAAARDNAAAKAVERGVAPGSANPLDAPAAAGGRSRSPFRLRSAIHPASRDAGGAADPGGDPVLMPVVLPPGMGQPTGAGSAGRSRSSGLAGSSGRAGSPIPGADLEGLFTGLPEDPGSAGKRRRGRPKPGGVAVPRVAMVAVIIAVVAATLAGVMLAGPRQHDARSVGDVVDHLLENGLPTLPPRPTLPRPTSAPATPAPTPEPVPTAEPWIAAAEHLAQSTFAEDWSGRMTLQAELRIGGRDPLAWTLSVARAGRLEWSKRRIVVPVAGPLVSEAVLLDRTVWTRDNGGEWVRADRGFGDRPTEPLFGVPDARGLVHLRSFKERGEVRHEFDLAGANDLLALAYLRDVGVPGLDRTGATVVTDAAGDPVRAELTYAGATQAGKAKLTITVTWKDVGGDFTIQSPKDGPPVVD